MKSKTKGQICYYDSFVPEFQEHGKVRKGAVELTSELVESVDLVIVTTAHTNIDYHTIQKHAKLIFDTKNAMKNVEERENIELL